MQRIIDPETYDFYIMHKEMACPTGLLYKIVHSSIQNQHDDIIYCFRNNG